MKSTIAEADETAEPPAVAVRVWDLPIRAFHWSLVALLGFSWWSAESGKVQWHLWSGYAVLFALLFRIAWGLIGSSTARFSSFVAGPSGVMRYLRNAGEWDRIGHTPLGALSVMALLVLVGTQVALGLLLSDEDGIVTAPLNRFVGFETAERARDLHEAMFNILLAAILLHVAAILFYRLIRRRGLTAPMINGSTDLPPGTPGLVEAGGGRLALALSLSGALTAWIIAGAPPLGT